MTLTETDRAYVIGRLNRDHIESLAEQAKIALAKGETVEITYMPGDASWYAIIIAPVWNVIGAHSPGATDGTPQSYIGGVGTFLVVYAQAGQAVWCEPGDDYEWIAQKFDTTPASQLAIAELLKAVF